MRRTPPEFAEALLRWYDANRRRLPWRERAGPYEIMVSEFMLQQTRVETVVPYYRAFLARFPDVRALAEASEEEVLSAWQGLGYYGRARNLRMAARECVARYGARVPDSAEEIARLPGIGPYVAGAVLSIAYGKRLPAVDGNVMRVFSRLLASAEPVDRPAARRAVEQAVRQVLPHDRPGDFNQALMELGATICLPKAPRCLACPVARFCAALQAGAADSLPVRGQRRAPREVDLAVAVAVSGGRVLIARRPSGGLLGGLWEFPNVELAAGDDARAAIATLLRERFGLAPAARRAEGDPNPAGGRPPVDTPVLRYEHAFTHVRWRVQAHRIDVEQPGGSPDRPGAGADDAGRARRATVDARWVAPAELDDRPLPTAFRPVVDWVRSRAIVVFG